MLYDGDSRRFYVGKSNDIEARVGEHKSGRGASCFQAKNSRLVKPITASVTMATENDWESWERNETLTRMYEYGIDNVRGWMFTSPKLSKEDKETAYHQICEKFDLCRRCGAATHFARSCRAKSRARWGERLSLSSH